MKKLMTIISVVGILMISGCQKSEDKLMMSTTTSLNDSGVLDVIKQEFLKDTGIDLSWVSVGSGEAMKLAQEGGIDLLFAHSEKDELKLVDDGVSQARTSIMFNNFLLVGPEVSDKDLAGTIKDICENQLYISRADNSGTYNNEQSLFKAHCDGQVPKNYLESGTGMADTLQMASEKGAYTLVDYATWLAQKDKLNLKEAFHDKDELKNTYSIHKINYDGQTETAKENAKIFVEWIQSDKGQKILKEYGIEQFGSSVFTLINSGN